MMCKYKNGRIYAWVLMLLLSVLLVDIQAFQGPKTLTGKLIKLKVKGPQAIEEMMEAFLTEHDFVLVDDDQVPLLSVEGTAEISGDVTEGTVLYRINRLALKSPDGKLIYSASNKVAVDYGRRDTASQSALHLLKVYLHQDQKFMDKLDEVGVDTYFQFSPESIQRDVKAIKDIIIQLMMKQEENDRLEHQLQEMAQNQRLLKGQLAGLARQLREGRGRMSEKALVQAQQRLLRALKEPYLISGNCPQAESRAYGLVEGVLIFVPLKEDARIKSGTYFIYAGNQRIIYERTKDYPGPRVFSSMELLKMSSLGQYFKSPERYLSVKATIYRPADRAVIVSECDAEAILYANLKGSQPGKIFLEGRVVLIGKDFQ